MKDVRWRKSSYSGQGSEGECVEVAPQISGALVRDTKDRDGGFLSLPGDAWKAFLEQAPRV